MNKFNNRKLLLVAAAFIGGSVLADEHGHMHHKFPKDVDAFHSVLAPVWHARPGPERLQDACAKAGEMATLANEIRSRNASQLMASISVLKAMCESDKGGVDAALFDVHEAVWSIASSISQSAPTSAPKLNSRSSNDWSS